MPNHDGAFLEGDDANIPFDSNNMNDLLAWLLPDDPIPLPPMSTPEMADFPMGLDSSSLMTLAQAAQQGLQPQPQQLQQQPQQQPLPEWMQRDPPSAYAPMPLHDVVPDRPLVTEEMHAEMVRLVGVRGRGRDSEVAKLLIRLTPCG
jgi:hypothetical protein